MRKSILAVGAVLATASMVPAGVFAQSTSNCTISNTGTNSNNVCQFTSSQQVIYTCSNSILVVNGTNQASTTGIVQTNSNTTVGNVGSGDAINEGDVTTNASATCNPPAQQTVTPTTPPSQPPTPPAVGNEEPTQDVTVTELPDTDSGDIATIAGIAIGAAATFGLASSAAISAYRSKALSRS